CLLVAEAGTAIGYLLGFAHDTFYANGPVAWVEELMVGESWRRQHVGQRLIQEFEAWAANRGCRLVALATRRAEPFYKSLGYEDSATYFRRLLA
ncbi:MAG TPA: GNAT family N-acetyltransferase, partial [Dehalococcoidia bacterium]|nr:GNAT family N-acetyltransferase [Dehalococcoidia bacterium]